ncbi:precorrin-6Y C5,15-methyltransferase (decarboxylating) subunit CbiT [Propionicicella superfundia]|uniref:precorrin-6Y C5,15-methyltransferase (decarboxylating) subunit CbiT n=1 Tax=Propionicicella superfundia TaxID=348582 RepID=UPI0003F85428|nr:precorrin-6Y C5,15-methyltransferase (decarboxylating) subunit CbiT [Propionicicella superfundia]
MDVPASDPLSAGLPDDVFVTDGLLTKRVMRAYALAMLAPAAGERLWDLGAGTGSIGIEWCRLHAANRAVAVERNPGRAERIALNAANLGVADRLDVVVADVPAAIDTLPPADAIFVGGGLTADLLGRCWSALPAGGRLACHSVTADSDAILLGAYREWGGELSRIGVEAAEPIGRFVGFKPLRTVTAWSVTRPVPASVEG